MLATANPQETYRRIELDARIAGADTRHLVGLCYERLAEALAGAVHAHAAGDNLAKSRALTRAISAITALQLGVGGDQPVADVLRLFYEAARRSLLDCAVSFDPEVVVRLRADFAEIGEAMRDV